MKYKYFLFDWDGSLGNSLPLWFSAFHQTFAEFGKVVSYHTIGEKVVGDWNGPARVGVPDQAEFFKRMEDLLVSELPKVQLNPSAKELMTDIKAKGGKIAVVTTSKRAYVEPALDNNGITGMIDVFLAKEDVKKYKPDPEQLLKAVSQMGGKVEESLMTGDTRHDALAAKNCGMDSALYYPDIYEEFYKREIQEELGATYLIKSFDDLRKFL